MTNEKNKVPVYGWKCKLDYKFPQSRSQFRMYNFRQIWPMLMLVVRYLIKFIIKWFKDKSPVMDYISMATCDQQSGVPIGGIGGGSIGRGFRGEFSRFQMLPGVYEYPSTTVEAAQFIINVQDTKNNTIYQKVLTCQKKPKNKLKSWEWNFPGKNAEYTALYPRSWTVFEIPEQELRLICRQISPIIPNNYKDSSIPGAVFVWLVENYSDSPKNISITFTFESGIGFKKHSSGDLQIESFSNKSGKSNVCGNVIKQRVKEMNGLPLTYGIAALKMEDNNISSMVFDPNGDGKLLWEKLKKDGELEEFSSFSNYSGNSRMACGVCNRSSVNSNATTSFAFSLTWDSPHVRFPEGKATYRRFYTKYFGDSGNMAPELCLYCLDNYVDWERCIEKWQAPILENLNLPDWYKSALFNELYYISDGGTIWLLVDDDLPTSDPRKEYGRFSYLEGHEYRMCLTYDVHYYASFALILLWPKIQLSIQYDFRDAIPKENTEIFWFLYNGERAYRKKKNTVPHDLGDPREAPFELVNSYDVHDVSNWKDLNLKYVLQVYRDFVITGDINYVHDMFSEAQSVMNLALTWGAEEDGMIKNSGFPDQTYDAWTMSGVSSYCGSLWIASLVVFIKLAKLVNETNVAEYFTEILNKAKVTFENKLWTGQYYRFDSSGSSHSESIMADQLNGLWYLHCCDVKDEIFPSENVKKALSYVYKMNVCSYYQAEQGAVNGMLPNGAIDKSAVQSEEVWTGVTYSLASLLIFEGFVKEGFSTAEGLYRTIYEKSGLGFATPEAIIANTSFRALAYMRPLSIWAIQLAIDQQDKLHV